MEGGWITIGIIAEFGADAAISCSHAAFSSYRTDVAEILNRNAYKVKGMQSRGNMSTVSTFKATESDIMHTPQQFRIYTSQ